MEKTGDSREALEGIKNVGNDRSWFRGTLYYWVKASLPFAYALACVEVVSESSEKAGVLYDRIVEAWSAPGIKSISKEIAQKAILLLTKQHTTPP